MADSGAILPPRAIIHYNNTCVVPEARSHNRSGVAIIEPWQRLVWVGVGGALGSVLRYGLAGWVQRGVLAFPLGTFAVNVLGCLAIGFFAERLADAAIDPVYRTALLVGVLGGFTTFSTFSYETLRLLEARQHGTALLNVTASVLACLAAAWFGQLVARWMATR